MEYTGKIIKKMRKRKRIRKKKAETFCCLDFRTTQTEHPINQAKIFKLLDKKKTNGH